MAQTSRADTRYDRFLYATLYQNKETSLSVLSALARQDMDGWEEAARLAKLSKYDAINSLSATIWRVESKRWSPSEATILAARLIDLLPAQEQSTNRRFMNANDRSDFWTWVVYGAVLGSLAMTESIKQQNAATPPPAKHYASEQARVQHPIGQRTLSDQK